MNEMNDVYQALGWWRTSSTAEKEKAVKKWRTKVEDYRKNWDIKRIGLSDSTVMEVYKFVK